MTKTLFTILILLGVTLDIYSQDYISKQEAIEDINYFFNNAEQIHPNLYFKISKSDLTKHISAIENEINDSISVNDFSRKMRTLVNYIGDGHTNFRFSKELNYEFKNATCRLPFKVEINSNKFIVSKTETDELIAGDEIVSINNIEANKLLSLKKYCIADNESFRRIQLEENLSFYLYVEYGFTEKASLQILRNGEVLNKEIELLQRTEKKVSIPEYTYKTVSDTVGVLQINTFYRIDDKSYRQFLDSTLNQINRNNITLLIIDLRNNGGGNSYYGDILLPYINVTKYKTTLKVQVKTSKLAKKMRGANLFKKNGTITDLEFKERHRKAIKNAYQNNVCVLTSNDTYSSAADFAVAFRYAKRGLIVGDTIGQPYSGYIDQISFTLPNSKLSGGVSFKKYEFVGTNESNKHQGIQPDIYIDVDNIETESEIYQLVFNKIRNANRTIKASRTSVY